MAARNRLCFAVSLALATLPIALHAPSASAQSAPGANDTVTLDTVVVQSQRESQERAIDLKRSNDAISDAIAADSLGQYPDKNVAESLQRLPGVSVTRDQGEARFVVVRGLDAALNSVTVNGVAIGTPESSSRSATLDVIPSDSTERITVIKAPTPDMPGDSIGGSINIESASGFDRDGRSVRGRIEASHNQLSGQTSPKLAFNYSDVLGDTFGVALGLSYQDRDFESDNIETDYDFDSDLGEGTAFATETQIRKYFVNRERLGANLNLDWRPNADSRYYLRTLYSDFTDAETRQRSIFGFGAGDIVSSSGGVHDIENIPADEIRRRIRFRTKEQSTLALSVGGSNRFANSLLDYNIGYTDTNERVADEVEGRFEYTGTDVGARVDQTRSVPRYDILDPAGDAWLRNDNYQLDRFVFEPKAVDDDELSAAVNFAFGSGSVQWKTGLIGRWRDREADVGEFELRDVPDLSLGEWTTAAPSFHPGQLGDGISSGAMLDYLRDNGDRIGERPKDAVENMMLMEADSYTASENINAGYLMATMDFDALRVIAGARVERTDFEATGTVIETGADGELIVPFGQRSVSSSYTNVLPGLHLRYDANDWVLRGAWTNTVSRPAFGDASPRLSINLEDAEIDAGNPGLDPYESSNFDFSAERYIGNSGIFSVGLFHKSIDGYIAETTSDNDDEFPGFEVTRPVNGDDAQVTGIELNWQQQLSGLPGALNGLLVGVSATVLDTEFTMLDQDRSGETFSLPRASDEIYSAFVGYEHGGLSSRLALVQRGEYLDKIGDDANNDIYVARNTQLDFQVGYAFNDAWTVYLEAANLLDEPLELYQGTPDNTLQQELYGRTYALGLKANF